MAAGRRPGGVKGKGWLSPEDLESQFTELSVHQMERASADQVENSAGGFVWKVDDVSRLRRFLCLGTDGGTYYIGEKELTAQNAKCVIDMIKKGRGLEVVEIVKEMSVSGRTAKQNPILFCLALCARMDLKALGVENGEEVKREAYAALPAICRIPTHLFTFVNYAKQISKHSGWGRAHRAAICRWYTKKSPMEVAMAVTKYQQREGWSHRDLLRLAHPRDPKLDEVFCYAVKGWKGVTEKRLKRKAHTPAEGADVPKRRKRLDSDSQESQGSEGEDGGRAEAYTFLEAVEDLKKTTNPASAAAIIQTNGLVREHVPTQLLGSEEVWRALLLKMPMTAMLRNLAKMTSVGLLTKKSGATLAVVERLQNAESLHKARIHPFNLLVAQKTYASGKGDLGKLTWNPVEAIVGAMDEAFYLSFHNVPPTNQRVLIALDVSGSMDGAKILKSSLTAREASAAMSMLTLRTEPKSQIVGFFDKIKELSITKEWDLPKTLEYLRGLPFGQTDCSLPMTWALKGRKPFDLFLVYTDSETYAGKIQPAEALKKYRKEMNIPRAKLIVVGMTSNGFSIADPKDPGMLDVVGFDSAAPEVMANFAQGLI